MAPKKKPTTIKAELVTGPDDEGPSKMTFVFYAFFFTILASYSLFLYDSKAFNGLSKEYTFLKPIDQFFQAVEEFSPFHEFLNDNPAAAPSAKKESKKAPEDSPKQGGTERIFTKAELKEYDGSVDGKGPYLAVLGQVFDVSKGKDKYGPGMGYGFFSGIDGTRAFVTGEFNEEGLIDEVTGLSNQDYLGLQEWAEFYHSDYTYVGKVVGNFYGEDGSPTQHRKDVSEIIIITFPGTILAESNLIGCNSTASKY